MGTVGRGDLDILATPGGLRPYYAGTFPKGAVNVKNGRGQFGQVRRFVEMQGIARRGVIEQKPRKIELFRDLARIGHRHENPVFQPAVE